MPLFEVFIPANSPDDFDVTARIRGDTWMQALRNGITKLGVADVRNVFCDITEAGIDVTEPASGRVFRIRELSEQPAQQPDRPPAVVPLAGAPRGVPAPGTKVASPAGASKLPAVSGKPPAVSGAIVGRPPPAAPSVPSPALAPRATAPSVGSVQHALPPSVPARSGRFAAQGEEEEITRERPAVGAGPRIGRAAEPVSSPEDIIATLFEQVQEIYTRSKLEDAAHFLLDLAMRVVPCESGSVFISDINRSDLAFAAARGPKAQEVLEFRVPMGQGIVGFAAQEGVSLAVSDVQKDPRFYAAISRAIGYETRSLAAAPATHEGRTYGALELINRKGGSSFAASEIDVLSYLARAFADYLISTGQTGD